MLKIIHKLAKRLFIPAGLILAGFLLLKTSNNSQKLFDSSEMDKEDAKIQQKQTVYLDEIKTREVYNQPDNFNQWCQIDYQDLSKDSIFQEFQLWLDKFNSVEKDSDYLVVENLKQFLLEGEKLAQKRAKVLQKIIRGDPKTALRLAIPRNQQMTLPATMERNLEKWESDFGDIQAMHVCFDPVHPGGYINRTATMQDGRKLRAWVFGKRKNLPSISGLAVWGISIGDDFAISDLPIQDSSTTVKRSIRFGGKEYNYSNAEELGLFQYEVRASERRSYLHRIPVRYPRTASSSGLTDYYEKKYDLFPNPSTWEEAKQAAADNNGSLVVIGSQAENDFISRLLNPDQVDYFGINESGQQVEMVWIGATDNNETNSTVYDLDSNTSSIIDLNASEGDWKWLDGTDVGTGPYRNWPNGEPNSSDESNQDYAALDWSTDGGTWTDVNASYRLPFIIEYKLVGEPVQLNTTINGHRKVLVVPARFQDESYNYSGSGPPLVDEFGNPIFSEIQQDTYEPVSQNALASSMEEVREFFLRNSDGAFDLEPVITPTVTIPHSKYSIAGANGPNLYDSSGQYIGFKEKVYDGNFDEMGLMAVALDQVAAEDEAWNITGPAFQGVSSIKVTNTDPTVVFSTPPVIDLVGGGQDPDDQNRVRQRFKKAQAEAIMNGLGQIVGIKVLDAGAYYFSSPEIKVNGETTLGYTFHVLVESILVSWGSINTYDQGAAGVGYVGAPGFWAMASGGYASSTTIAHELGHNFGLQHANRLETRSEKPNSDESVQIDYGNPYSVMGTAPIIDGGDFTIASKVMSKNFGNFGLVEGNQAGIDVARLLTSDSILNSVLKDNGAGLPENTFRIYRHDYMAGPLSLRVNEFSVFIPESAVKGSLLTLGTAYPVAFNGTGEGAVGELQLLSFTYSETTPNATLTITLPGIGYASEPRALVYQTPGPVGAESQLILSLDAEWIKEPTGTNASTGTYSHYTQSELRDHSDSAKRGIRGIRLKASDYSPKSDVPDLKLSGEPLNCFWLSYRKNAAEFGISVLNGNTENEENFLIDMTLNTPQDFSDAFLLLGNTFSDYDSDVHFTPIAKGGTDPMEYLQVVVNMGTVQSNLSSAPQFTVKVSNNRPEVGEFVSLSVQTEDNNASAYAYSWFVNEVLETDPTILNKPFILKAFSSSGDVVIRVVVSDFKGGISSRNVILKVGDYQKSNLSTISGTVRSGKGNIEGARISLSPAAVINHTVSLTGNPADRFIASGKSDPLSYLIDGVRAPNLNFRRGEIHRFHFDPTTEDYPMFFLDNPEFELPTVSLNMLVTPIVENVGSEYKEPPDVVVSEVSTFATYFSDTKGTDKVGDISQFQADHLSPASPEPLFITRPFAKSLLVPTMVDSISVSPVRKDIDGNYVEYGGKGHNRDNPPNAIVYRSSFWENYGEQNATAKAYVDGVGTISPVRSSSFNSSSWETRSQNDPIPELVVWGSGGSSARPYVASEANETNASVVEFVDETDSGNPALRIIEITNQGQHFEPDSTMAVLHYPLDPFAYWTFDRHESLFDDSTGGRYQPSPGWNAMQKGTSDIFPNDSKLTGYWSFDDENESRITTKYGDPIDISPIAMTDANRSYWGVKGRSLRLNGSESFSFTTNNQVYRTGSLSMWLKPEGDFVFEVGTTFISYNYATRTCIFGITDDNVSITRSAITSDWMHLAVVGGDKNSTFYLDGKSSSTSLKTLGELKTSNFLGLLDETHIFSTALSEAQIKILAGKTFLDLSGNKIHAVPVGPDFPMSHPDTDPGLQTDRPSVNTNSFRTKRTRELSPPFANALGDSYLGEGHGRSLYFDDNDSYLDLSPHAFYFAAEDQGSISFWVKTDGRDENGDPTDQNLFTAACLEDNASFFRLMIRDTGVMQLHAVNDGNEVAKFYTDSSTRVVTAPTAWHHVVLVVDGEKSQFWIDGKAAASKVYASAGGENSSGDKRAFFSDIENLDFLAIGSSFFNIENNNTENFLGYIDDFYIYNRALNSTEINYLYDLRMGREQVPRLEAVVDAVGTVKILDKGEDYQETPDIFFTYGLDNNISELEEVADYQDLATISNPADGKLVYVRNEGRVYNWHFVRDESEQDWRYGNQNNVWTEYLLAYGYPNLNTEETRGKVAQILWTRDMGTLVQINLPDSRPVFRQFLEYVVEGDGILPSPNGNFGVPHGIFGYSAPPDLLVEGSTDINATGYSLFFADLNHSAEIINPGIGLKDNAFDGSTSVRISGKGHRPSQWRYEKNQYGTGNKYYRLVETTHAEYWGRYTPPGWEYYLHSSDDIIKSVGTENFWFPINSAPGNSDRIGLPLGYDYNVNSQIDTLYIGENAPSVIVEDWNQDDTMGEPRDIELDFNKTLGHITLEHTGVGYAMPVEILLIKGQPQLEFLRNWVAEGNTTTYNFIPAQFRVDQVDVNGSIISIEVVDGGLGYVNEPTVVITGGGGFGAEAEVIYNDSNGSIEGINVTNGGRGYYNIDPSNKPTASLAIDAADPLFDEVDATLSVRLGGFLDEIPRCSACDNQNHAFPKEGDKWYHHKDVWIEIWDRNRSEITIDRNGDRALAAAKVRNGKIEKIVVVNDGRGYVDPVAYVRAGPPHMGFYYGMPDVFSQRLGFTEQNRHHWNKSFDQEREKRIYELDDGNGNYTGIPHDEVDRIWRCVNMRENKVGVLEECGHIHAGQYPPESCPGEVSDDFPIEAENTQDAIGEWQIKHIPPGTYEPHRYCRSYGYNNDKHWHANFRSRRCTGTKANYVLLNDLYRAPYENWENFNAKIEVIVKGGKIQEMVVMDQGSMYAASEIVVEGSGVGVDAIPIYNERGENIRVIYDDPKLKNLENDYQVTIDNYQDLFRVSLDYEVFFPSGAGQGFQERPWSWDWNGANNPTFGPREKVLAKTIQLERVDEYIPYWSEDSVEWSFGTPSLKDSLGDRVREVTVEKGGSFRAGRPINQINFDYNSSLVPDADGNGSVDFISASATPHLNYSLSKFHLDEDASYIHGGLNRSLFLEEPTVNIFAHTVADGVSDESPVSFMRLNGVIGYDNDKNRSYVEIYVDDSMPAKFHYGFGTDADGLPAMGGEIVVTDSLPVMSWGQNDPMERSISFYTDAQGQYFLPGLEPGLYNIGVFMEDRKFQDLSFRPDSNLTRISDYVYIPGFTDLLLETDARGAGVSRLVWSEQARRLSRPDPQNLSTGETEIEYEQKTLEGIGKGFIPSGAIPELIVLPHFGNSNEVSPNIEVSVLPDGSLKLFIVDDANTTAYNPSDRFTISYSSTIQGIDFKEFFQASESGQSDWGGYLNAENGGIARLEISPNDANGTGFVEVPLSTSYTGSNPFEFVARAYELNGTELDVSNVQWNLSLSFSPPEGNQSLVAKLNNTMGSTTSLITTSTLRTTGIVGFEIRSAGTGYQNGDKVEIQGTGQDFNGTLVVDQDGNITDVNITDSGTGYSTEDVVSIVNSTKGIIGFVIDSKGTGYQNGDKVEVQGTGQDFNGTLVVDQDGNITDVNITNSGSGYSADDVVSFVSSSGLYGALTPVFANSGLLTPVLGGSLYLDANLTSPSGQVLYARSKVFASTRNQLTNDEKWLDLYFDSIQDRNSTWWTSDLDNDNLSNLQEKVYGTHPLKNDTDGDLLTDDLEIQNQTNPHQKDTDGDGLWDYNETVLDPYNNNVIDFEIDSAGTGYIGGSSISVAGNGSNFSGTITVDANGKITGVLITNPGAGYNPNDIVTISGNGSGASLSPLLGTGTDPRKFDTDGDGMNDGFEVSFASEISELNPTYKNTTGKNLGGYIFNLEEYSGELYIKVKKVNDGDPVEVKQEIYFPWQKLNGGFPLLYNFENLPTGYTYQVSVFIDTYPTASPNGSYEEGEPSASWQGILTTNKSSANLFLMEDPPDIYFRNPSHQQITLPDPSTGTFSFSLSVEASDLLDKEWDLNSSSPKIQITSQTLDDSYLTWDKPNLLATVARDTPLGTYTISYQATDSSGSQSKILTQTIIIDDTEGPKLTLLGGSPYTYPYGSPWVEPGWKVYDNRDDESEIDVIVMGTPDVSALGSNIIQYQALDSAGNKSIQSRIVQIIDDIGPTITVSKSTILLTQGQSFTLPTYSAIDNVDGDLSGSVQISGVEAVDVTRVGDYEITFSASDSSVNNSQLVVIVRIEPPAYSLQGNAIDGYLVGAKVILDANGDGQNDLSTVAYTQENGEYLLGISQEEFLGIDQDADGVLDPSEGRIVVTGGVDSSTAESFKGALMADANASVVTPLTSLVVGLMDQGIDKSTASTLVLNSLGLSSAINLTDYDPYENAASGDAASVAVLVEGARIANLMKQTEAFVSFLKGNNYSSGSASLRLLTVLVQKLKEDQSNLSNPLDNSLENIILSVISSEVDNSYFTSDEIADFIQIVQVSDSLHKTLKKTDQSPTLVAAEITKQQLAVKQEILDAFEEIANGTGTIKSVASSVSQQTLEASAETFLEVNLFAPSAEDFTYVVDQTGHSSSQELISIGAVDLDGDVISFSILSGNVDTDGDGIDFVQINQDGQLVLQDASEITNLISQSLSLSISLSDSRGKNKTITGVVMVENALVMESTATSVNSWMNSSWLGSFHKSGGPWIFHEKLGWQYLYKLSTGGYWFWDKEDSFWWWSSPETFPYAFDNSSNSWIFFSLDSVQTRIYNFNDKIWRNK